MKNMYIEVVCEFNEQGYLLYAQNYVGAFVRGKTIDEAIAKFPLEITSYLRWLGEDVIVDNPEIMFVQSKYSKLAIHDADTDIIFSSEMKPLDNNEYQRLKQLSLKSAFDFQTLYDSISDKDYLLQTPRSTFYGKIPCTAKEVYNHTKNVNAYYFGEIGIDVDNEPDIYTCRMQGFNLLEQLPSYLDNQVYEGSYNEKWSLRKVLRRFLWHDRIHAKSLYRLAVKVFGKDKISNPFHFM